MSYSWILYVNKPQHAKPKEKGEKRGIPQWGEEREEKGRTEGKKGQDDTQQGEGEATRGGQGRRK